MGGKILQHGMLRFHSTDCPSEWGLLNYIAFFNNCLFVSIQLIAPASGAPRVGLGLQ